MKLIKVKILNEELTEDAQQRIQEASSEETSTERDEYGRDAEWYLENGIKPPEDLSSTPKNNVIELGDGDFQKYWMWGYFNLDEYLMHVDDIDGGCTIYLKGDKSIWVLESAKQIENKILKTINK